MVASLVSTGEYVFDYLLLKLASRCNLNCSYCYWFRDPSVYAKPAILDEAVETAFVEKLERHVRRFGLRRFFLLMHGGEPLLFPKRRFDAFCGRLRSIEADLGFSLKLSIMTNGVLIDEEWIDLFDRHRVNVGLSLDGPPPINDLRRVDHSGRGTASAVTRAIELLRARGRDVGVLAVCDPASDPVRICEYFADDLGLMNFDVLVPDATHDDPVPPRIARYYKGLFDVWYERYAPRGVQIRLMSSISKGLLGLSSGSESIGFGEQTTFTMLTDGSLEALDVLRIRGSGSTMSEKNILWNELQDVQSDPLWREVRTASVSLHATCRQCVYRHACGGGHIASRWSSARRFDNPSIYCDDFKEIFAHAWRRIQADLYVESSGTRNAETNSVAASRL